MDDFVKDSPAGGRSDIELPVLLVLRQTGLGDLASGVPALRGIRRAFPDHWMKMSCPRWLVPLAEHLKLADELVIGDPHAGGPLNHEATEAPTLAIALAGPARPNVVVVLTVPKADVLQRIFDSDVCRVIAYRHPDVDRAASLPVFTFEDHILVRWERLLGSFGVPTERRDLHLALDDALISPVASGCTVIHAGAASPARRWPEARWASVASALEDCGHRVVLTGSEQESGIVARVRQAAALPPSRDLAGRTNALELAAVVRDARLVLSCDTGTAHLAYGLRRPSVTLFGAVPPAWWGPPPRCPLHRTIWKGKYGEPYAAGPDDGLLEITVREVLAEALKADGGSVDASSGCALRRRRPVEHT